MPNRLFEGKVVVVTGGACGFGAEFARSFAAADASVVISDILEDTGRKTAHEIAKAGGAAHFVRHDVRSDEEWGNLVDETLEQFGGIDILINNAGIEVSKLIINTDAEEYRNLLDINLVGPTLGLKHAFLAMKPGGRAGKGGVVINLSSVAGITSTPGVAIYSASKAGIIRLTEVAAVEAGALGYGVRVHCLCPSLMRTELGERLINDFATLGLAESTQAIADHVLNRTPLGRFGTPADVAKAALYLASDAASFLTGVSLPVDGGMSLT